MPMALLTPPYDAISKYYSTNNSLNVYPNPAANSVTISTNNNSILYDATIYCISGSVVMQSKISSGSSIQIGNLHSGNYIVELKSDSETLISRFVKQ